MLVVLPLRSLPSPNRSAELMEVFPDRLSSLVFASYWETRTNCHQHLAGHQTSRFRPVCLTSALLSRPKNMSEEMAFAFANFCRASLDSETGDVTSAFLLLGSL